MVALAESVHAVAPLCNDYQECLHIASASTAGKAQARHNQSLALHASASHHPHHHSCQVTVVHGVTGIPDKKAGTIANGAIAAQLARTLQEFYLAIRAGREDELLVPLLRIDSLLRTLPLAQTSAEAAMVGDNISNKATLEERQVGTAVSCRL